MEKETPKFISLFSIKLFHIELIVSSQTVGDVTNFCPEVDVVLSRPLTFSHVHSRPRQVRVLIDSVGAKDFFSVFLISALQRLSEIPRGRTVDRWMDVRFPLATDPPPPFPLSLISPSKPSSPS